MSTIHKCPVCEGRCTVPQGFYSGGMNEGEGAWPGHITTEVEMCKSCQGRGFVLVSERQRARMVGPSEYKGEGVA